MYGTSYIYGYNKLFIYNTKLPLYTLKKNSNSICYHAIKESAVMGGSLTTHILTNENPSDLMAKVLAIQKRQTHVVNILYDIYDEHH